MLVPSNAAPTDPYVNVKSPGNRWVLGAATVPQPTDNVQIDDLVGKVVDEYFQRDAMLPIAPILTEHES